MKKRKRDSTSKPIKKRKRESSVPLAIIIKELLPLTETPPWDILKLIARDDILNQAYNVFTSPIMWPTSPPWRKKITLMSLLFNINKWLLVSKEFSYLKENPFIREIYGYAHGFHRNNSISLRLGVLPKEKKAYTYKDRVSGEERKKFSKTNDEVTKTRKNWWCSCRKEIISHSSFIFKSNFFKYKQKAKMPNEKRNGLTLS